MNTTSEYRLQYFSNRQQRQFFRRNSLSGGTYLECWSQGSQFSHILSTVELGTEERLQRWIRLKRLAPGSAVDYDEHFFQLCREIDSKHSKKSAERQKMFDMKRLADPSSVKTPE